MTGFRKLSDSVWASPQVSAADMEDASAQGFTLVINNRPDGEEAGQPTGAEIATAARQAGMAYAQIPIDHSGISDEKIAAMAAALADAGDGSKVLAYCRTGTRSTFLWSMAEASKGAEPDAIIAAAADAGYDVSMMRSALRLLSEKTKG